MKTIFQIAYAEIRMLFYSPIAWLLLCLFAFQANMAFCDALGRIIETRETGVEHQQFQTYLLMVNGVFSMIVENLFWYIPVLTMGLMSREYSSGSIKLLYSSPISCNKIIFGKYIAMLLFGVLLLSILVLQSVCANFWIKDFDILWVISGIIGIFLVYSTYVAIGLFMSSLTSYQIVAAIGTLAILIVLNGLQEVGQDIDFIREIAWWLALAGRGGNFIQGLIGLEDIIYFITVIGLFLTLTILKLRFERRSDSLFVKIGEYLLVAGIVVSISYISSRPFLMKYWDATAMQLNTIPPKAQEFMKRMDGDLSFTLYVNVLDRNYEYGMPNRRMRNYNLVKPFLRFKPETKVKYVYYYDECDHMRHDLLASGLAPKDMMLKICQEEDYDASMFLAPDQVRKDVDLSNEGYRLVYVLERGNGQRNILRFFDDSNYEPSEREIAAALKRLIDGSPKVCFLTGHGERSITKTGDSNYYMLVVRNSRSALSNQGFTFATRQLQNVDSALHDVDILVIADPQVSYSNKEIQAVREYINGGGNLLITGELLHRDILNQLLREVGVQFDTCFVNQFSYIGNATELIPGKITEFASSKLGIGQNILKQKGHVVLNGGVGLKLEQNEFDCTPIIVGPDSSALPLVMALNRTVNGREQRIIVAGDADLFSAGEIRMERAGINNTNFEFMENVFSYLANGEYPIDTVRPESTDDVLYLKAVAFKWVKWGFVGGIPLILITLASLLLIKRKCA